MFAFSMAMHIVHPALLPCAHTLLLLSFLTSCSHYVLAYSNSKVISFPFYTSSCLIVLSKFIASFLRLYPCHVATDCRYQPYRYCTRSLFPSSPTLHHVSLYRSLSRVPPACSTPILRWDVVNIPGYLDRGTFLQPVFLKFFAVSLTPIEGCLEMGPQPDAKINIPDASTSCFYWVICVVSHPGVR